jgi:hypothetical protein
MPGLVRIIGLFTQRAARPQDWFMPFFTRVAHTAGGRGLVLCFAGALGGCGYSAAPGAELIIVGEMRRQRRWRLLGRKLETYSMCF